uniref:hypothetical protein n=1 Tax=Citrobacter freundii TaxID=546 RepID=UPI00200087BC
SNNTAHLIVAKTMASCMLNALLSPPSSATDAGEICAQALQQANDIASSSNNAAMASDPI